MSEVEDTIKKIMAQKGVLGILIMNNDGIPIRTTLDSQTSTHYCSLVSTFSQKARTTVRDLDPANDLTFIRIHSKKSEIMVAPEKEYIMVVIQKASSSKD